ncbi:MAG: hypothetical protein C4576_13395 [Desulfobacteraceae bacterium]|nr:MAG: hypothetical protein C4576_13395 [Desulfobacteraceae bacterium]
MVTKASSGLPPVIHILRDEGILDIESIQDLQSRLTDIGLIKDLSDQSEWTFENYDYVDYKESSLLSGFSITAAGSMNPFSPTGKCNHDKCHAANVAGFVRTVGLYADQVYIPDPFSGLSRESEYFSDPLYLTFLKTRFAALKQLLPLIDAGIIRLTSPMRGYCRDCYKQVKQTISNAAEVLAEESKGKLSYEILKMGDKDYLALENPVFNVDPGHPLLSLHELDKKTIGKFQKSGARSRGQAREYVNKLFVDGLRRYVQRLLFEVTSCQKTHSTLVSASRQESLVLTEIQKRRPPLNHVDDWEQLRSVNLPLIGELTPNEILILRNESRNALPRLRKLLSEKLNVPQKRREDQIRSVISELQAQAEEVEVELAGLSPAKERKYRFGMGALGISFVLYGFSLGSAGVAATSIASLLALLAHLRSHERTDEKEVTKVSAMPGFVLFKAREILNRSSK